MQKLMIAIVYILFCFMLASTIWGFCCIVDIVFVGIIDPTTFTAFPLLWYIISTMAGLVLLACLSFFEEPRERLLAFIEKYLS